MKTTTIYIAEDGTKFLKLESCLKYEKAFNENPNPGIILLNDNGSIIPLNKYRDAYFITVVDPYITSLRLESIRVEEEFPFITNMPKERGYYSFNGVDWNKDTKEVYDFCTSMNDFNDNWYTLIQLLLNIHECNNNMNVKVTDVEGNLIYDKMPVRKAMHICIDDAKNVNRKMVWHKELEDTTYIIIH